MARSPFLETALKVEPRSGATLDEVLDEMCRIEAAMERLGYDLINFCFLLTWRGQEHKLRAVRTARDGYRDALLGAG